MSTQKKVKIDPKVTAKIHEELRHMDSSESEHEIDQIMSEIELLQKRASEPVALRVVPQPETSLEEDHEPASDSLLEEFRGGGDEPSMEETLSDLRDEGPSGPSLLDDPIEAVAEETMPEEEAPEEAIEELTEEPEEKFESKEDLNTEFDKGDVMSNYEGDGTMTMVLNGNMTL